MHPDPNVERLIAEAIEQGHGAAVTDPTALVTAASIIVKSARKAERYVRTS